MRLSTFALAKLFGADATRRTLQMPVSSSRGCPWHLPGSAGPSFVVPHTELLLVTPSKQLPSPAVSIGSSASAAGSWKMCAFCSPVPALPVLLPGSS